MPRHDHFPRAWVFKVIATISFWILWFYLCYGIWKFEMFDVRSMLGVIAGPIAFFILARIVLEHAGITRDEDVWVDWKETVPGHAGGNEIGSSATKNPESKSDHSPARTGSAIRRHRRTLKERTRFWSLHKHANNDST